MRLSLFSLLVLFTLNSSTPASMMELDQKYRSELTYGTTDPEILAKIDEVCESDGVEACIKYYRSLDLSLEESVRDSLSRLQNTLDFQNHMTIRGIWERYGWIGEDIAKDNNGIQILLLMHPPYGRELIPAYHKEYADLLIEEVKAGRMPAKTYAMFYDNILGKILRKPQLYGTNMKFDVETNKVLPPGIADIEVTNAARQEIGLDPLVEGEYRIEGVK